MGWRVGDNADTRRNNNDLLNVNATLRNPGCDHTTARKTQDGIPFAQALGDVDDFIAEGSQFPCRQILHRDTRAVSEAVPGNAWNEHLAATFEEERRELHKLVWAISDAVDEDDDLLSALTMRQRCRSAQRVDLRPI
jgi:hypothetical protein